MCHNDFFLINFDKNSEGFGNTFIVNFKLFKNIPMGIETSFFGAFTLKNSISDNETTDNDLIIFYCGADLVFNTAVKIIVFFSCSNFHDCVFDFIRNNGNQKSVGFFFETKFLSPVFISLFVNQGSNYQFGKKKSPRNFFVTRDIFCKLIYI